MKDNSFLEECRRNRREGRSKPEWKQKGGNKTAKKKVVERMENRLRKMVC